MLNQIPLPEALEPYGGLIVGIAKALLIFVLGWFAAKWVHRLGLGLLRRRKIDEAVARFLAVLLQYMVLAATVIAALGTVGIETTSLVAVLGSIALAVGLALQGSLAHFASGVMILMFRPFAIGDVVTVGGNTGTVEEIGLFATTMLTADNHRVVVPNSQVTGSSIINLTVMGTRRGEVSVGVAYGTSTAEVMAVLLEAAKSVPSVLAEPAPAVALVGFGASSVDYKVFVWAKSADWLATVGATRVAVYEALDRAGIEIPFDQVVVHRAEAAQ